ncbi:Myb-like domain-containing protein [Artemisia annua]|uniref:Myb-like domain-containing protein n=1 Tax=Artemisia annua TaxID=35608 RepID=A0A2U1LE43_ARTAN|nr:Myb-like domain-containing protein [Artemisia annua]
MDPSHLHHMSVSVDSGGGAGAGADRFPQWSVQETREFLMIRAELDPTFMETKRNKVLWEVISTKMKERGYNRSGEQCKCKWKNLVTRYKGFETMEQEGMRQQFPYYNELQAIFTGRMQRMLWMESTEGGGSSKKRVMHLSSDDDDENEESDVEKASGSKKKKKIATSGSKGSNPHDSTTNVNLKEILEDLMKQQMQMETQWMKMYEAKEEERRNREMEWRRKMEALENERIMLDQRWREREEQRRIRDETRSEKRDALITALLNKLQREDL